LRLAPSQIESLIGTVAASIGIVANAGNPIVEGELLIGGLGWLPCPSGFTSPFAAALSLNRSNKSSIRSIPSAPPHSPIPASITLFYVFDYLLKYAFMALMINSVTVMSSSNARCFTWR
jgi:hypothetical protein